LDSQYTVATNAFIADDGRMTELFISDYDVFQEYLIELRTVEMEVEGRITIGLNRSSHRTIKIRDKDADNLTPNEDQEKDDENISDTNDGLNDGSDSMTDGNTLPSTATNMFNMITIGFILVASGGVLYFVRRKQK
jgi:2',3'-cyclic-nucleotide 2'-phosphodiesterase / 3'-nucleotidase / 5'-nucleotidase